MTDGAAVENRIGHADHALSEYATPVDTLAVGRGHNRKVSLAECVGGDLEWIEELTRAHLPDGAPTERSNRSL